MTAASTDEMDLRDAIQMSWASLRRYKVMQLAIVALALAAAGAYLALRSGAYTASARVLVDNRVLAIAQQDAVYSTSALTPQLVQSQVEILRSEAMAQEVIDQLQLMETSEFTTAQTLSEQQRRRQALDQFKRRLSVEVVPQSHVIEVRYTSREAQRAADVTKALVDAYLQDQTSANTAAAKSSSGWLRGNMRALGTTGRLLGDPMAPVARDGPTPPLVLGFALFCGFVTAAAAALMRGLLDHRVRTPRDIERAAGYRPLSEIPRALQDKGARPLLTKALQAPKSQFAHAIQRIAVSLPGRSGKAHAAVVGVTALHTDGGATLVCANLARSVACSGKRVLLVDASLYSGTLTELAQDHDRLDDDLLVDRWSGLHFTSLLLSPRPADALDALLQRHRNAFDLILVDLPALRPAADAAPTFPLLDGVVLVIAAGEDDPEHLRNEIGAHRQLREKLAGVVLNKTCPARTARAAPFYQDERFTAKVPPLAFVPTQSQEDTSLEVADGRFSAQMQPRKGGISVHSSALGVIVALLCGLLALEPTPARADDYRLGAGDTLRLKVSEWPDLTGEYTLSAQGRLSLPLVGNLEARGLTVPELSAAIGTALQKRAELQDAPAASVAIVTYRPFFVLGDVQKPGAYPYQPGLNVLQAISVAGGYYRPLDTAFRLERDAITARAEISREMALQKRIAARIARLEAERNEADVIAVPTDFDMTQGSNDQALIAEEQTLLRANKEALARLLASLDHYKDLYEQEIKTVTEQIATERQQASAVQRELDSLKGLLERGLSPLTRQLTTERTLAQISGTIQGLQATILRARQNIGLTDQRRIDALNARTTRIAEGLQQANAEAKDAAQRLRAARALLEEALIIAPGLQASQQRKGATPRFSIMRASEKGTEEISAEQITDVKPGDVLTVERTLLEQAEGTRSSAAVPALSDGRR